MAVIFIGGRNRSIRRKRLTCHKSLTNYITQWCIQYTLPWYSWNIVESGVKHNNPNLMQIPVDDKYYQLLLKLALSTIDQTKPISKLIILYLTERRKTFQYIVNSIISTFIYFFVLDTNESNWQFILPITNGRTNSHWWYNHSSIQGFRTDMID